MNQNISEFISANKAADLCEHVRKHKEEIYKRQLPSDVFKFLCKNLNKPECFNTLGLLCYAPWFPDIAINGQIYDAIGGYLATKNLLLCRQALNVIANIAMHNPTGIGQIKYKLIDLLDKVTTTIRPDNENVLKLYNTMMRCLRYTLAHGVDSSEAMQIFLPTLKVLYIGTTFAPSIEPIVGPYSGSSSDYSDSENMQTGEIYYHKIRSNALVCFQLLFKFCATELFPHWSSVFWSSATGSIQDKHAIHPSLTYYLITSNSVRFKGNVLTTINHIIEHSPLSNWFGFQAKTPALSFRSLGTSVQDIIFNLYELFEHMILNESSAALQRQIMEVITVLTIKTPKMDLEITETLINAIYNLPVSQHSLYCLSAIADRQKISICNEYLDKVGDSLKNGELVQQSLIYLSKIPSEHLESLDLMATFKKYNKASLDKKTALMVTQIYERVIDEHSALYDEVVLDCLATMATNTGSLNALCKVESGLDQEVLKRFCSQYRGSADNAYRASLMKFLGSLIKADNVDMELYNLALEIITKSDKNLATAVASSLSLTYLCAHPFAKLRLAELVETADRFSNANREKLICNSVVSVGILFQLDFATISQFIDLLFQITTKSMFHKNAKISWESLTSLELFIDNTSIPHEQFLDSFGAILTEVIANHANFKTKIMAVKLMRKLPFLQDNTLETVKATLEADTAGYAKVSEMKYQKHWRWQALQTIYHILCLLPDLEKSRIFLSTSATFIYSQLREHVITAYADEELKEEGFAMVIRIATGIHTMIESDMYITVPFSTVEGLESLQNVTREKADQMLGYGMIDAAANIEIKSNLTPMDF